MNNNPLEMTVPRTGEVVPETDLNRKHKNIYPNTSTLGSLSFSQNEQSALFKLQADNLFFKLEQIEKELQHYHKLKNKWNLFKNILHYSKYPFAVILGGLDVGLIFTGVGIPIAVALAVSGAGLTLAEVISTNVLEDSLVNIKLNKYETKCKHLKQWVDRMYLFKTDVLKDGVIDEKEINQWKDMLKLYDKSLIEFKQESKNAIDLKVLKDQIDTLMKQRNQ
jgi:hypothetical protein